MKKIKIVNKKRFFIILIVSIILILLLSIGFVIYYGAKNPEKLFTQRDDSDEVINGSIDINEQFDENKINILIFGLDKNEYRDTKQHYEVYRSDTIMLATIDLEEKTVDIVSIPRDTYVPIYNKNFKDKINTCFYYGKRVASSDEEEINTGIEYLTGTVSNILGNIPINYYIGITDMDVVTDIIDEIGGIDIDVLYTLYANKGKDKSKVEVEKGFQTLDGKDLLYYARYRMYPLGDIDRVSNQQHIIKTLMDNLKSTNKLIKIPQIYKLVSDNLTTNLSFTQISALSLLGLKIDLENVNTYTLPGDFGELGGLSYWIINQNKRIELIKDLYSIDAPVMSQDAKSDKLINMSASIGKTTLQVGEKTSVAVKGRTANSKDVNFNISDTNYSSSIDGIVQFNADNTILAKAPGNVTISFTVEGVTASASVTVEGKEQDTTKPTFKGIENKTILQGTSFNKETGVIVIDEDSATTWSVSGEVDTNTPGTYTLTYKAIDTAGNQTEINRVITVEAQEPIEPEPEPAETEGAGAGE